MTNQTKPRYEFIDLMKGICITMVVMSHCQLEWISDCPQLTSFRMPLYYILSGIFFKPYGSFKEFALKKTNSLIIPFLSTIVLYNLIVNIVHYFTGGYKVLVFNPPSMWFLISLFQVGIVYYYIQKVKNTKAQTIICLILSLIGYALFYFKISLPAYLDTTLSTIIFYHIGYLLKKAHILPPTSKKRNMIFLVIWLGIFIGVGLIFPIEKLRLQNNIYPSNYIISLALAISGTMLVLYLSKLLVKVPFISFIGRYSIIVLCTHNTFINLFTTIFEHYHMTYANIAIFIATMAIMPPTIYFILKYIPFLFAQQPFFHTIKMSKLYRRVTLSR